MNFFDQKDVGNHPLKLCPKVVKHPVYCCLRTEASLSIVSYDSQGYGGGIPTMEAFVKRNSTLQEDDL
jgi:hypothetical protein